MKKIIYIVMLLPLMLMAQANFSTYGAVGNGVADDTAALQSALDNEPNLIADANSTFRITSQLDIDAVSNQIIDWNNSTVVAANSMNPCIRISKLTSNGGTTAMSNLVMDGNDVATRGIYSETRVVFNNVSVKDFNQGGQGNSSAAGFFFRVKDDADSMGEWTMNDCSVTNLVGASIGPTTNCVVASNVDGSVNGVLFYWDVAPTTETILTWNNLNVDGMWGDDGGGVFINNAEGLENTTSKQIFNGGSIKNCERRALKGFSSNMEFNNVTFESPISTNPNIQCGTVSGMVVFGGRQRENIFFDGCTFIGTPYEGRVIPISLNNWSIKNSLFVGGAYIDMTNQSAVGVYNGLIECNDFGSQGLIKEYTDSTNWTDGTIGIGGNLWDGRSPDIDLLANEWYATNPVCDDTGGGGGDEPTCFDDTLNGDETGVDCGGSCEPCSVAETGNNGIIISRRRN
jgi:hypothetical protein